jgi:histidine triad (HIT) family protein
VPRQNGDKLSFAKAMLPRHDPDSEKTGRTLREALEKIDANE